MNNKCLTLDSFSGCLLLSQTRSSELWLFLKHRVLLHVLVSLWFAFFVVDSVYPWVERSLHDNKLLSLFGYFPLHSFLLHFTFLPFRSFHSRYNVHKKTRRFCFGYIPTLDFLLFLLLRVYIYNCVRGEEATTVSQIKKTQFSVIIFLLKSIFVSSSKFLVLE